MGGAEPGWPGPRAARRRPLIPYRTLHAAIDAGYAALLAALAPYAVARACADRKARARWLAYLRDLPARFGRRRAREGDGPCVWVHGVSVGEVKAAARLVSSIEETVPGVETVVTATTDTGLRVARERYPGRRVEFYPPDLSWVVRGALDRLRPGLVVLVESEFWPNFLVEIAERRVPVVLVNGRISERSAVRLRRAGPLGRALLSTIELACVQLPAYAERFLALGVPPERVVVTGNLKFDNVPIVEDRASSAEYAALLGLDRKGPPVVVAGSTHPPEERWFGATVRRLRAAGAPCRVVVAPRHPARADDAHGALEAAGLAVVRRSRLVLGRPPPPDALVLLDTVGELERVYQLADMAFVGGSLVRHGGQNMMEPASLGKPVVVGPHTWNFRGEVDLLETAGGIRVVDGPAGLEAVLASWLADPEGAAEVGRRGRQAILDSKGATARTLALLSPALGRLRSSRR